MEHKHDLSNDYSFKQNGTSDYSFPESIEQDTIVIEQEFKWLKKTLKKRIKDSKQVVVKPQIENKGSNYGLFIAKYELNELDQTLLLLALAFSIAPISLTDNIKKYQSGTKKLISEQLGFVKNANNHYYQPTLRSAILLLCGKDKLFERKALYHFEHNSRLIKEKVITLKPSLEGLKSFPLLVVSLDPAYVSHFYHGAKFRLDQLQDFQAQLLETKKRFEDLVLNEETIGKLLPLMDYMNHYDNIFHREGVNGKIKEGLVVLFHGYPGTGKTYTANVIGRQYGIPVYKVDLATLVSKYIGETSKNLKNIFDRLQNQRCILFFDEADAIFGKRTEVKESKDRYSNQEVSYLLQAIEDFNGIVILSTNFSDNIDAAFRRRIDRMINFKPPEEKERLKLWNYYFPEEAFKLESPDLLERIAHKFSITGANIANIMKLCCIEASGNITEEEITEYIITEEMIYRHLSTEYYKDGRNLNDPHRFAWEKMKGMS